MKRLVSLIGGIALAASAGAAFAQTAPADSSAAAPATTATTTTTTTTTTPAGAPYSTSTTQLGVLFADPAAKAVVAKYLPDLVAKPDILDRASGMTLQELRAAVGQYAPNLFNDKMMAAIDADLAKLPPPKN